MKSFFAKHRVIIFIALAAVILELFVFNFRFWESLPFAAKRLENMTFGGGFVPQADGTLQVEDGDLHIDVLDVDADVRNVFLDIVNETSPDSYINVNMILDDEANREGLPLPGVAVVQSVPKSLYHRVYMAGQSTRLRLLPAGYAMGDNIRINEIAVNVQVPLFFSPVRCLLVFAAGLAVWGLRPKSRLWQFWFGKHKPGSRKLALIAIALVVVNIAVLWGVIHSFPSISDSFFKNNGGLYPELAKSLANGRFYLDYEASPSLINAENPYDVTARRTDEIEYIWDAAYYNGKYYCYYGVTPALLFHLPVYLLSGRGLSDAVPIFCFGVLFIASVFLLLYKVIRLKFERVPCALYLLLAEFLVIGSAFLVVVRISNFYIVPTAGAAALVAAGLALWLCAIKGESLRPLFLFLGSACMALVVGCRPQQLLFGLLAVPIFKNYVGKGKLISLKKGWGHVAAFAAPFAVFGAFMMYYNAARFASPFDFGSAYNLTSNDLTHNVITLPRALEGFFYMYLQPPLITSAFPFLAEARQESSYLGLRIAEYYYGGTFAVQPMLWAIFGIRRVKSTLAEKKLYGTTWFLAVFGVFLGVFAAVMAGILQRYTLDYSFALCAAAILVLLAMNEAFTSEGAQRKLRLFVVAGLAICIVYNAMLFFAADNAKSYLTGASISVYNPKLYYGALYAVQFWT